MTTLVNSMNFETHDCSFINFNHINFSSLRKKVEPKRLYPSCLMSRFMVNSSISGTIFFLCLAIHTESYPGSSAYTQHLVLDYVCKGKWLHPPKWDTVFFSNPFQTFLSVMLSTIILHMSGKERK